ncbi:MAG: hypothetical protein KGR98_10005 [Verrucomicrobia bacterium]|nr:hypothetical protein [Verrucomicrobiota bacterium]MDE3100515.1 hypothetical protein [Verrucomicrobiota bacterium]
MPKPKSPTPVVVTKHKDKRANIPTEELRDAVRVLDLKDKYADVPMSLADACLVRMSEDGA